MREMDSVGDGGICVWEEGSSAGCTETRDRGDVSGSKGQ